MYEYRAKIVDVYDGDTLSAVVDLGFGVDIHLKFRLAGIQAPEITGPTKDRGKASRDFFVGLIGGIGSIVTLRTYKDRSEKYGRYLADVILSNGVNAAHEMVKEGHAVWWDGSGPRPVGEEC